MILVFEDLHLADPGTLAFVRHLADHASGVPLLVLCTARLELLERDRTWGGPGADGVRRTAMNLAPLSGRDTRELLGALGGPEMARSLPVLGSAGGNPLYLEAYVRLREERPGGDPAPPPTLTVLMAERLDALDPAQRALVEDAAVVGKVFWPGPLEVMGARRPQEVEAGLQELTRRQMVRPARRSSVGGQSEHAFWHLAVRDAALEHMDPDRRAAAHRAALAWAAGMTTDRSTDHAEILLHQAARATRGAGDAAAAREAERRFARLAADRAAGLDPARAAELYRRAAALSPPGHPDRERLLERAARAEEAVGEAS
jgi:predicted ATPase